MDVRTDLVRVLLHEQAMSIEKQNRAQDLEHPVGMLAIRMRILMERKLPAKQRRLLREAAPDGLRGRSHAEIRREGHAKPPEISQWRIGIKRRIGRAAAMMDHGNGIAPVAIQHRREHERGIRRVACHRAELRQLKPAHVAAVAGNQARRGPETHNTIEPGRIAERSACIRSRRQGHHAAGQSHR